MSREERDAVRFVEQQSTDEHPQTNLQRNPSTESADIFVISQSVLDFFDALYSDRAHRTCMNITFFTLLSMTLSVITWMFYWITYNRCENTQDPKLSSFLCDLQIILEVITFTLLSTIPVLFILMILSWIRYSCHNPIIAIREKFIGFRLENEQWKVQLDDYYRRFSSKISHCCRLKQKRELYERNYGYVILSSHGIVIDELMLLSADRNIIESGQFLDENRILQVNFKRSWTRPWRISINIHLPNTQLNTDDMQELHKLAKVPIDHCENILATV